MSDTQRNADGASLRRPWRLLGIGALVCLIGLGIAVTSLYVKAYLHLRSGRFDLQRHHNDEALSHLQAYLRIWPKDPQALLLAARASWRLQNFDEADSYLQKHQQVGGNVEEFNRESLLTAAARGEIDRAAKYFQDQSQRPDAALPLILEALVSGCLRQERLGEAKSFLQKWLDLQPDDTQALVFEASLDRIEKTPQDAIAKYRHVLEIDPEQDLARLPLTDLLVQTRQYEEAVPLLEALRQRQPNNAQVLVHLAKCRDYMGQQETAERLLDQVLAQSPDHVAALSLRGELALHGGQSADAEKWLRRALARAPGNYQVNYQLVECLQQQGRTEEMNRQLERFKQLVEDQKRMMTLRQEISSKPDDPSLSRELAMLFLRNGNAEGGLRFLLNAVRENPTSAPLRQVLNEYYQQLGNRERPASRPPFASPDAAADLMKPR